MKEEILKFLDKLTGHFPCPDLESWNKLLPSPLAGKAARKGPAVYEAKLKETSFLSRVELRADFAAAGSGQTLTVEFKAPLAVSRADLDGLFKEKAEASGATVVYPLKGKEFRATFAKADLSQLTGFVVDSAAAEAKRA